MKVFDIKVQYFEEKIYSVVAEDEDTARKLFIDKHPYVRIDSIKLHSDDVIVEEEK